MPRKPRNVVLSGAMASLTSLRGNLVAERDALERRIAALNNAIAAFGGSAAGGRSAGPAAGGGAGGGGGRGRGRRSGPRRGSLKEYILNSMKSGQPAYVKDITNSVVKSGYKSKNKTLAKSVGIALAEMVRSGHVVKEGRGQFRVV